MHSRLDIQFQNYCALVNIEAKTMIEMAKKEILPAASKYSQLLSSTISSKKAVSNSLDCSYEMEILTEISTRIANAFKHVKKLECALASAKKIGNVSALSVYYKDKVLPIMEKLRAEADALETLVSEEYWPIPTYGDLMFGV